MSPGLAWRLGQARWCVWLATHRCVSAEVNSCCRCLSMRVPGQDPVAVELQEPHERRRRCRRAQREPYPVSHLELLSGLLEQSDGMVRRALREHDRVSGPEEGHGEQPFAYDHYQACENPVPGRLHPPGKDQGPDTCDPTGEAEGREEIARTPDSRERHRSLERVGYVVKGIGIDDQSVEHEGTEKDHQHPRMRQDERECDLCFLHELLLWFRRYNDFSELRGARESTTGATPVLSPIPSPGSSFRSSRINPPYRVRTGASFPGASSARLCCTPPKYC